MPRRQGMQTCKRPSMLRTIDARAPIKAVNLKALQIGRILRDSVRRAPKRSWSMRVVARTLRAWSANRVAPMAIASLPIRTAARYTLPCSRISIRSLTSGSIRPRRADDAAHRTYTRIGSEIGMCESCSINTADCLDLKMKSPGTP